MLRPGALLVLGVRGADDGLDLIAVDDAGNIGVGDLRRRETAATKANKWLGGIPFF